ncbi:MAG TPA: hypothetical protein VHP38_09740 [Ruminiclostridium sp.]|nr:hypothetical protein [Ruminiclostridium sp.]
MNEFYSWEYLSSFSGIVASVTLIIQFSKVSLDKIWKIPTRFVVWLLSYVMLILVSWFTVGITLQKVLMSSLNAVVVTLASMGAYEATFKEKDDKG